LFAIVVAAGACITEVVDAGDTDVVDGVDITESTVEFPVADGVVDTEPLVLTDTGLLAATAAVPDKD
jgi:hypothetical protein